MNRIYKVKAQKKETELCHICLVIAFLNLLILKPYIVQLEREQNLLNLMKFKGTSSKNVSIIMYTFEHKVVLVTGGASGIGFLMGVKALQRGAKKLIIWDVDESKLLNAAAKLTKQGFSVGTKVVDISNPEEIQKAADEALDEVASVDILFNNAGVVVGKKFEEHTMDEIRKTMDVNSTGMMCVAKAFLPAMLKKGEGYIVNIASAAGLTPNPGMTVYAASKWAAVGWSESLRIELEQTDKPVKILTVMPGYINTGMFAGVSSPLFMPLLDPDDISTKIIQAVEQEKNKLREPFIVKLTPFIRGVLPSKIYDFVAGKLFGVYTSMDTFLGRNKEI